jgi:hypothetical protein
VTQEECTLVVEMLPVIVGTMTKVAALLSFGSLVPQIWMQAMRQWWKVFQLLCSCIMISSHER